MELSPEQQQAVTTWVNAGDSLAEIQRKLEANFGLKATFMEVRFLVDDLDLELSAPPPQPIPDVSAPPADAPAREAHAELAGGGGVSISVDSVQRPGSMISGNVTFGSGDSLGWQIDRAGRLGLIPGSSGYRPSPEDLESFQVELERTLRQKGLA